MPTHKAHPSITANAFAAEGDEWLLAYACLPNELFYPRFFAAGHAIELYLKAAYTHITKDSAKAIAYRHNLKALWKACRKLDAKFMPGYEFRDSVFAVDFLNGAERDSLSAADLQHYSDQAPLYLAFQHLPDLKYGSLPWNTRKPAPSQIAWLSYEPRWARFSRDLRSFVGYPSVPGGDAMTSLLKNSTAPQHAIDYIKSELYGTAPTFPPRRPTPAK